ncbi:MAG: hypothetical protein AseanaTS_27710 [Candidatus Pelagadaptatus aseana]|uniref:DUF4345 domain-containing protein n=1 Tax=Candidatus Pelagadaptatus aseana TaxID=3120508 RepID=UPI0039B1444E
MSKLIVLGTAAIFVVYGLFFIALPVETLHLVVDGTVTSSSGITDVRATYGGMTIAVGIILFMLGRDPQTLRLGLMSVLLLMLGMATGRTLGMVVDGHPNLFMYIYLGLELTLILVSFLLLNKNNNTTPA